MAAWRPQRRMAPAARFAPGAGSKWTRGSRRGRVCRLVTMSYGSAKFSRSENRVGTSHAPTGTWGLGSQLNGKRPLASFGAIDLPDGVV